MRRVTFTTTGWMDAPGFAVGQASGRSIALPAAVAVCERDDGDIWLVDAGWSAETCADPAEVGLLRRRVLGLRVAAGDDVATQMKAAGLDPGRVTCIIATHLHLDHVGGVLDFPNAELITTRDEHNAAQRVRWLSGYRSEQLERVRRLRLVDLEPSAHLSFARTLALGDDVVLLDAPGHSDGHAAVFIRCGGESYLHAGDAAYFRDEIDAARPALFSRVMARDYPALLSTHQRIREAERSPEKPRLVLSHDPQGYRTLPKLCDISFPAPQA